MDRARQALWSCLRERREEIERAILTHIDAPAGRDEDGHVSQLAEAVSSGVAYCLAGIESRDPVEPVPPALLLQARRAARRGASLEAVLSDCFAGYVLFCDFLVRATEEHNPHPGADLRDALHVQAILLERMLIAVVAEHARQRPHFSDSNARQLDCVKRMLAGESIGGGELAYETEYWHVGAVAKGREAARALGGMSRGVDCRLLLVCPEPETVWAWFGAQRCAAVVGLLRKVDLDERQDVLVALGEPARGIEGFRLTHRQAGEAIRMKGHGRDCIVRYSDVGLLASASRDPLLRESLRQLYISPLSDARGGGGDLRNALRAYLEAGHNVTAAASALGVSRQTVRARLRAVEERIGRTLESCAPELEMALRLEDFRGPGDPEEASGSA